MAACKDCGGEVQNKNESGHFRDHCCSCIINRADADPDTARPIPNCSCEQCRAAR